MKKLICMLLSAGILISAVGCGNSGKNETASNDKTKLVFWHTWNDEALKADIDKYNKTNTDNIEVEFKVITGDYRQSVDMAVMSNNAPDVITAVGPSQVTTLAQKESIIPLTEYLTDEFKSNYIQGFETQVNGVTYGVSGSSYIRRMLYNADLFKKCGLDPDNPPKTLDEMLEYARIITEKGNGDFYGMALPIGEPDLIRTMIYRIDEPTSGVNGGFENTSGTYTFERLEPIVSALLGAYNDKVFLPGSATMNADQEAVQFAAGKTGMTILTSGFATRFGILEDLDFDFDMRSCDIPAIGEIKYHHLIESPGAQVIMSACKNKDAAWKFMEWLMAGRGLEETDQILNSIVPYNKEVIEKQNQYFKTSPTSDLFEIDTNDYVSESLSRDPGGLPLEGDGDSKTYANILLSNLNVAQELKALSERYTAALKVSVDDGTVKLEDYTYTTEENPYAY